MTSCQRHSFSLHINTSSTAACIVQMKYCHTDMCLMSVWKSDIECSVHRHGVSCWTGCLSAYVTVSNVTGRQIRYMMLLQCGVCGTPYWCVRPQPLEQSTVIKNVSNTNCRCQSGLYCRYVRGQAGHLRLAWQIVRGFKKMTISKCCPFIGGAVEVTWLLSVCGGPCWRCSRVNAAS